MPAGLSEDSQDFRADCRVASRMACKLADPSFRGRIVEQKFFSCVDSSNRDSVNFKQLEVKVRRESLAYGLWRTVF